MIRRRWVAGSGLLVLGTGASGCFYGVPPECGTKEVVAWDGKIKDGGVWQGDRVDTDTCFKNCGSSNQLDCTVADAGALLCTTQCYGGRAPAGLAALSAVDGSAGAWLARMAELETAAVYAFARLADELDAHGLADHAFHARQAALDEVKHADAVTRLALQLGHCPAPVFVAPAGSPRPLAQIAIENAAEGCGRELYGAELNVWQARHATDDRVRAVMASIAGEERAHAGYSFALADALAARLPRADRRRAAEAQERMLSSLGAHDAAPPARRALGLMEADEVERTAKKLLDVARLG